MAIVNVDLSEYDALRNRAKELEEQNKELKEQIKGLKNFSRVIIRNVRRERVYERTNYGNDIPTDKFKPIVESESIVGFEDVRLKIEERMKNEIERSIKRHNEEAERYAKRRTELEDKFNKQYDEHKARVEEKYKDNVDSLNKMVDNRDKTIKRIKQLSDSALSDLHNRIFEPKSAILIVEQIRDLSNIR